MKKFTKVLFSPATTIVAFVLAVSLLLFGSIGGARAALTYFSETYSSQIQMYDIGVTLRENGQNISWRDYDFENADGTWDEHIGVLLGNMLAEGESLQIGRAYKEELSVYNSGTINQYVRVSIYKYWLDENGNKLQELSPELIDLHLVNLGTSWLEDVSARTPERTVLYYNRLLNSGVESPIFSDTLTINGNVAMKTQTTTLADGTIKTEYSYNGTRFCLEAKVDAVQENSADDAVLSAWGTHVVVDAAAGTLNLQ